MVRRTISAARACLVIVAFGAGLGLAVQQENPSITLQAACCPAGTVALTASRSDAAAKTDDTKTKSAPAPESTKPSDRASASPISLEGSLKPLVERFNAAKGKLRFVTILSPT